MSGTLNKKLDKIQRLVEEMRSAVLNRTGGMDDALDSWAVAQQSELTASDKKFVGAFDKNVAQLRAKTGKLTDSIITEISKLRGEKPLS